MCLHTMTHWIFWQRSNPSGFSVPLWTFKKAETHIVSCYQQLLAVKWQDPIEDKMIQRQNWCKRGLHCQKKLKGTPSVWMHLPNGECPLSKDCGLWPESEQHIKRQTTQDTARWYNQMDSRQLNMLPCKAKHKSKRQRLASTVIRLWKRGSNTRRK